MESIEFAICQPGFLAGQVFEETSNQTTGSERSGDVGSEWAGRGKVRVRPCEDLGVSSRSRCDRSWRSETRYFLRDSRLRRHTSVTGPEEGRTSRNKVDSLYQVRLVTLRLRSFSNS